MTVQQICLISIMQAVFFKYEQSIKQVDCDRTDAKLIIRKQNASNAKYRKSRMDESQHIPQRDKHYHSSNNIKFIKTANNNEDPQTINHNYDVQSSRQLYSCPKNMKKQQKDDIKQQKNYVFNKLNRKKRNQINNNLQKIRQNLNQTDLNAMNQTMFLSIIEYINKLQENNAKLTQVNYLFQKQFNDMKKTKQITTKNTQKCQKEYCTQCRYHLQKQKSWQNQKNKLQTQINHLKLQIKALNNTKLNTMNKLASKDSINRGQRINQKSLMNSHNQNLKTQIVELKQMIQCKNQEYVILLKQFNYLDGINKDVTKKMKQTLEQYRYLSIENRTLLNVKTKLIQKQLQCLRLQDQKDYFKNKIVEYRSIIQKNEKQKKMQKVKSNRLNLSNNDRRMPKHKSSIELNTQNDLLDGSLLTLSSLSNPNQKSLYLLD